MQFEYLYQTFRIAFRHDRSRNWVDHAGHQVELARETAPKGKNGRTVPHGPAFLVCVDCTAQLGVTFKLSHLTKGEKARKVYCAIYRRNGDLWEAVYQGEATVNLKAGDVWTREAGRVAALKNALSRKADGKLVWLGSKEFRAAVRESYKNRSMRTRMAVK